MSITSRLDDGNSRLPLLRLAAAVNKHDDEEEEYQHANSEDYHRDETQRHEPLYQHVDHVWQYAASRLLIMKQTNNCDINYITNVYLKPNM